MGFIFSAFSWLTGSAAGKLVLKLLIGIVIAVIAIIAFLQWKAGIEAASYKQGFTAAQVIDTAAKKDYFDQAGQLVADIRQASVDAATRIEEAGTKSSGNIDKLVGDSITKWAQHPVFVVDPNGKCEPTPDFGASWNAINHEANQ
jgi:hypothetical protein